MRKARLHKKVLLWWGRWWAVQIVLAVEIALGVAVHWRRPMIDLYLGPLTIAFGRMTAVTDQHDRLRSSCRGFVISGSPDEVLL